MLRHGLAVVAVLALSLAPAHACMRFASPGAIDQALAESAGTLSPVQVATVKELRTRVADLLAQRNYAAAKSAEGEAMGIMGRTFESKGPPTRGCQDGAWVRKTS